MTPAVLEEIKIEDGKQLLVEKLTAFDNEVGHHEFLEIDGDIEAGGKDNDSEEHVLKIINHKTQKACSITIRAIAEENLTGIIRALETGVTTRLFGITRIVGYYSRINNWNKSKKSELADRHKGSYKLGECKNLM